MVQTNLSGEDGRGMTKDTVPQDYTLGLAIFDAVPVILFGLASWLLWNMTGNALILIGGVICFAAGMLKVLWKFIVVLRKKMSGRCLCRCESECRWGFGLTTCSL